MALLSIGDIIAIVLSPFVSLIIWAINYNRRWHGPTREEFERLRESYEKHVEDNITQFEKINEKLTDISVKAAAASSTTAAIKESVDRIEKRIISRER